MRAENDAHRGDISSRARRVLIRRVTVKLSNTDGFPTILLYYRISVDESLDGLVRKLVFQDDKTRRLRARKPFSHRGIDLGQCRASAGQTPIFGAVGDSD